MRRRVQTRVRADVRGLDAEVDARPGGVHRTALTGPDGTRGVIVCRLRELVPDERIVMTWSWVADEGAYGPQESLLTIELRATAGPRHGCGWPPRNCTG